MLAQLILPAINLLTLAVLLAMLFMQIRVMRNLRQLIKRLEVLYGQQKTQNEEAWQDVLKHL